MRPHAASSRSTLKHTSTFGLVPFANGARWWFPPHLIAEIIDRSEAKLPGWLVPFARGVGIASEILLRKARHRHGMRRPRGWIEFDRDVFLWLVDSRWLLVRECFVEGLWMVERWSAKRCYQGSDQILVHEFGSTPIFTRSDQAAMRLAMYCHENGPPVGLRWISACPKDYLTGGKRRIDEVLTRRNAHQEDHLRGAA
jgi:hypothetical protein